MQRCRAWDSPTPAAVRAQPFAARRSSASVRGPLSGPLPPSGLASVWGPLSGALPLFEGQCFLPLGLAYV